MPHLMLCDPLNHDVLLTTWCVRIGFWMRSWFPAPSRV